MKHLGLVPLILLIGTVLFYGPATAQLTAYQQVPSQANVGEPVVVTVMLSYNGMNSIQAAITPSLPYGVVTDTGVQTAKLYPGAFQPISYSITPEQSGMYWIVSQISYEEDGSWHNLMLEAPFNAVGDTVPESQPISGEQIPGGIYPEDADHGTNPPGGMNPQGDFPQRDHRQRGIPPNAEWQGNNATAGDNMPRDMPQQDPEDMHAPGSELDPVLDGKPE